MASETNSSLVLPSNTQESSGLQRTRGSAEQSTWIHSRKGGTAHREDPKYHYCLYCEQESRPTIYHTFVATNFRNHLKSA
jgi:hypothetical protein